MTKIERLSAALVSTVFLSIAIIVTMLQWRTSFAAYRLGPVDVGEGGFLLSLGAALTVVAMLTWRRKGHANVLWTLAAVLCWGLVAVDLAGFSAVLTRSMDIAGIQPLLAWAVIALAAGASLFNGSLLSSARLLLAGGLILQGLALAADLHAGTVFAEPNVEGNLSDIYLALDVAAILMIAAGLPVRRGGREVPLLGRLSDFAPAKYLSILWRDLGWRMWRLHNPRGNYSDFYVATVRRQLALGFAHRTLGRYRFTSDLFARQDQAREFEFRSEGRNTFEQIRALGLPPGCTVADFGCGSLRVGQHFIDYLDPGRYWGLDVTDRFYEDGLALLPPGLVAAKTPQLRVISPATLAECRAAAPDLVFSIHVLMHVPVEEMQSYWRNLASLLQDTSRAYVTCNISAKAVRTAAVNWAYPEDMLRAAIARAAPGRPVAFAVSEREKRWGNVTFRAASILIGAREL